MFTSFLSQLLLSICYVIGNNVPGTENLPRNTRINAGMELECQWGRQGGKETSEAGISVNKKVVRLREDGGREWSGRAER